MSVLNLSKSVVNEGESVFIEANLSGVNRVFANGYWDEDYGYIEVSPAIKYKPGDLATLYKVSGDARDIDFTGDTISWSAVVGSDLTVKWTVGIKSDLLTEGQETIYFDLGDNSFHERLFINDTSKNLSPSISSPTINNGGVIVTGVNSGTINLNLQQIGTAGNDYLQGNPDAAANDNLQGGDGNDILTGFRGADVLSGGNGDDQLRAGNGRDLITGGTGGDSLYGGFGNNTFTGERDGQVDSLYFKSDQFAYNWIYDSASNSPNGEKVDVIKAMDAHDQVFVQGVTTSELSFGSLSNFSTATGNFSGVGIYANGFLEAIYAGGDLNASQLQAMTSGFPV
ncbi:calcium-binding protein [Prochlorococcus marinus]|uniref:Calcium-binding protein n=1 Tax=Prochlorococcus marinus (strain MIT 9303) TaxID=59922 RepID=A2C967_PROM3|nr:calcium-binding protein [Prochlorococcus marinus]ABM78027.1 Hypothetical protein P9303_12801 [Prochlorococcus marinus str. MIT 9303]